MWDSFDCQLPDLSVKILSIPARARFPVCPQDKTASLCNLSRLCVLGWTVGMTVSSGLAAKPFPRFPPSLVWAARWMGNAIRKNSSKAMSTATSPAMVRKNLSSLFSGASGEDVDLLLQSYLWNCSDSNAASISELPWILGLLLSEVVSPDERNVMSAALLHLERIENDRV